MNKHTPGPWVASDTEFSDVYGVEGQLVAHAYYSEGQSDRVRANARLMAAAPDLLAACESIMDIHRAFNRWLTPGSPYRGTDTEIVGNLDGMLDALCADVETAIAKARGRGGINAQS